MPRRVQAAWLTLSLLLLAAGAGRGAGDALEGGDRRLFADGLFSRGLHDLALPEYAAMAARQPPPADLDVLLFRLAECQAALKRPLEAEAAYRRLAAEFPASPYRQRAAIKRALLFVELKQAEAAVELLDKLIAEKPGAELLGAALYHAGEALEGLGRREPAVARFEELRRALPDSEYAAYAGLKLAALQAAGGDAAGVRRAIALYREVAARTGQAERLAAEALFQAAMLAFNAQSWPESAELFRQLAAACPRDARTAESARASAWAHHNAGRHADALQQADAALAREGTAAPDEWLYLKANCERLLDRHADAVRSYDRLLALVPPSGFAPAARYERLLTLFRQAAHAQVLAEAAAYTDPPAELADDLLWLQAEAAAATGDGARAVQFYRLLAAGFPRSDLAAHASYRLGYELQRRQAWAEASQAYLDLVARHPADPLAPQALFASGLCLAQAGQGDAALRDWHALLTRHPDHATVPEALFQKAMEEIKRGSSRDAAASLDELLRRFPAYPRLAEARFWRGQLLHGAHELAEAEKQLRAALAANPPKEIEREASYLLGLVLQESGRDADAAATFQPLLDAPIREKFPVDRLCWLAEFQFGRGAWKESEAAARTLVARAPAADWQQAGWALVGRALQAQQRRDEAVEAFARAVAAPAQTRFGAEAALRLGELQLEAGRAAEAEASLRDAAARAASPDLQGIRAMAYAALGRALEARGDLAGAVRYHMSVAILFDDAERVPPALDRAATLLEKLGRAPESRAAAAELCARYPASREAAAWRARLAPPAAPAPAPGGAP